MAESKRLLRSIRTATLATLTGAGAPFPVCFAVDLAGNDHYATSTPAGLAAGALIEAYRASGLNPSLRNVPGTEK